MNYAGWDWGRFAGSRDGLRYNRRDLESLERVLSVTPGRTAAVQAGGNLGIFPKRLSSEFAAVYTFEPDPECFAMMLRNAPEPNIVKIQAALGAERGQVAISHERRDDKPVRHEGTRHVAGPGIIPTLRIDDLGLPVCDLIYLDIEGQEHAALRGAVETITRCRPVLAIEINKNLRYVGLTEDDVHTQIRMLEYRHVAKLHSDHLYVPRERA